MNTLETWETADVKALMFEALDSQAARTATLECNIGRGDDGTLSFNR